MWGHQKVKKYFLNNQNNIYYYFLFFIIVIIYTTYFFKSFNEILGDGWAYTNLFINYSGGLARRGLLGAIFLKLNNQFETNPLTFFTLVYFTCYFLQIIIFYKLFYKFKDFKIFATFLILSPSIIFFNIYDLNVMMTQDAFINLAILLHAFVFINKKIRFNYYKNFLLFLLFPLITINIFNHENQIFFIPFHFLLTYIYIKQGVNLKITFNLLKCYVIFLLPIFIILSSSGSFEKLYIINESIKDFNVELHNQFAGNFNLAIGGFLKWHFIYHDVNNFLRLLFCVFMSIFLIYLLFQNLINKKILSSDNLILKNYLLFILPSFTIFLMVLDHGRSLNMMTIHLISFYLVLNFNYLKFKKYYLSIKNNFFLKNIIYLFLFFYLFLWYLPQGGGYTGIGNFKTLFKSGFSNEIINLFLIVYNFIDNNFFELPRIIV